MRQIRGEVSAVANADGSAILKLGNIEVIAAVFGLRESWKKDGMFHVFSYGCIGRWLTFDLYHVKATDTPKLTIKAEMLFVVCLLEYIQLRSLGRDSNELNLKHL
ncbi:Exoribonuclease [Macleaya cordata]|uniref:Exoribonuclease n=1 Tax=Macleaya cordata TaxID=56857 RepID=A0A200QF92_MACCD|nr:Exoribonuclease [Macleaya cordata]